MTISDAMLCVSEEVFLVTEQKKFFSESLQYKQMNVNGVNLSRWDRTQGI